MVEQRDRQHLIFHSEVAKQNWCIALDTSTGKFYQHSETVSDSDYEGSGAELMDEHEDLILNVPAGATTDTDPSFSKGGWLEGSKKVAIIDVNNFLLVCSTFDNSYTEEFCDYWRRERGQQGEPILSEIAAVIEGFEDVELHPEELIHISPNYGFMLEPLP